MKLTNSTPFPCKLLVGSTGDAEQLAIIVLKVTYLLEEGGLVPVTDGDSWPVFDKPFVYEGITLHAELDYRKQNIDILVFGHAAAPNGKPCRRLPVGIQCGPRRLNAMVFGDRTWEKQGDDLVPSPPEPFTEMPLTNDRAFGGRAVWNDTYLIHNINPDGMGYYLSPEAAVGQPLPNIERPNALIRTIADHPLPLCFHKPKGMPITADDRPPPDPSDIQKKVMMGMFNQAVPELVLRPADLGERVILSGFSAEGELIFPMPPTTGPHAGAVVGDLRSRFPATLSTVTILAPQQVLIATYRCLFRYLFRPMESRAVSVTWPGDAAVEPPTPRRSRHA